MCFLLANSNANPPNKIMITKAERSETTAEPKIATMYHVHTFENKCMPVCM